MTEESLPLTEKNILIMRELNQARQLVEGIEELGGHAFLVPLLGFKKHELSKAEINTLQDLYKYNWLIFTSQNGVKFFMEYLEEMKCVLPENIKIAAVGTKTVEVLQSYGLKADFIPQKFTGDDMGRELTDVIGIDERVCIIKGNLARDKAGAELKNAGIFVDEIVVYDTYLPSENKTKLLDCLINNSINVLIFTSPSTVQHFVKILKESDQWELAKEKVMACIGPVTEKELREYGLTAHISPEVFTGEALLQEIKKYYLSNLQLDC